MICVSLAVHEMPLVVFDQLENFRANLPSDAVIVVHLSAAFRPASELSALVPPGVLVNEAQFPTAWGDGSLVSVHNSNIRFAAQRHPLDFVLLHASNDMYVRALPEQVLTDSQCAYWRNPVPPGPGGGESAALRDPALARMLAELGAPGEVVTSHVEGSFYPASLFMVMVELIDRHWRAGEGEAHMREETYYPSLATALAPEVAPISPIVYSNEFGRRPISTGLLWQLEDDRFGEAHPLSAVGVGAPTPESFYAVKRVARSFYDVKRTTLRTMLRSRATRMRLPCTFSARPVKVGAPVQLVVDSPSFISDWIGVFGDRDDVSLCFIVAQSLVARAEAVLEETFRLLGKKSSSIEVNLLAVDGAGFDAAALPWVLDAYIASPREQELGALDELPVYGSHQLLQLRMQVDLMDGLSSGPPRLR